MRMPKAAVIGRIWTIEAGSGDLECSPASLQPARVTPSRGFFDGFVGGLIGGVIYCLILTWLQTDGLVLAALRVVALSLVFGGFEMWRVTQGRTLKSVREDLIWTLAAAMLLLWGLEIVVPKAGQPSPEPPHHTPSLSAPGPGSRTSLPALAAAFSSAPGIPWRICSHTRTPRPPRATADESSATRGDCTSRKRV